MVPAVLGDVVHTDQQPYRELHDAILWTRGNLQSDSLFAWITRNSEEIEWLRNFGIRSSPQTPASPEELWRLYALSRVIELLALSFQASVADGSSWPGVSLNEFRSFACELGLTVVEPECFPPFDCEIVSVANGADRDQPVTLIESHWPCLMLGEMLVFRAGTSVTGGANVINPSIALSSTLYWACRRETRPHQDLSHGWGSNSQWRTSFRRDYRQGSHVYYNVDGKHDLAAEDIVADEEFPLTRAERIELLTHRCFIVTEKPSDDLWPYDDRITVEL